jgi:Uma2 family endonuclease
VVCGGPQFLDGHKDTALNPKAIVEVLSPSTEGYDRGLKFAQYRTIGTLDEYVLVSQTEARVEVFRKQADGTGVLTEFAGLEAVCRFESLGCEIPLSGIYQDVNLDWS